MGGTFTVQNKVRPGAYINFVAKPQSLMNVSDRGIATLALPMSWGPEGEVIDIVSSDLTDGTSLAKIGYSSTDPESKLFRLVLQNCYRLKAWRLDTGGVKAFTIIGDTPEETESTALTVNAKYAGVCGNNIQIVITQDTSTNMYTVETLYNLVRKDIQKVQDAKELQDNDFVTWAVTELTELSVTAGSTLTGGSDGSVVETTAYNEYWKAMKTEPFNTMGILSENATVKSSFAEFIEDLRENQGVKVQGCVYDYAGADYEGIISSDQGYETENETISKTEFVAWVTGATAGAEINQSNTHKTVQDAIKIIGEKSNTEIIEALQKGKFVISRTRRGTILVEKDINTLHTFTAQKSYDFSKNRVIRVLDEMGNTVQDIWDENYCGKIDNDAKGRNVYKADLIKYGETMSDISAITNFEGADDIDVRAGNAVDAIVVDWPVQPVDSMEKLYMTFTVGIKG